MARLQLVGGYILYCLYHFVGLPIVLLRFVGRLRGGKYRGVIWARVTGGTRPPKPDEWVPIIASGLGETRTAIMAADEIQHIHGVPAAVLTQLPKLPSGLRTEDAPFPVGFAPFNSPHAALIFLLRWRPKMLLFVEFSGNYHLAFWARVFGIRTALVNVNLPEVRLRRLQRKFLGRWQFSIVDAYCVQAQTHAERLKRLGVAPSQITVAGIGVNDLGGSLGTSEAVAEKWKKILQISADTPVLVAGSTYPEEEKLLLDAVQKIRKHHPDLILVLAPRHLNRTGGADSGLQQAGWDFERRSLLDRHERVSQNILLDSLGELRDVYAIARVVFVGGTLITHVGGHSPIEPFLWGVPITVGPHFGQQEAAVYFAERAGLLHICATQEALTTTWLELLSKTDCSEDYREWVQAATERAGRSFADSYLATRDIRIV